jgi:hypothetical protein
VILNKTGLLWQIKVPNTKMKMEADQSAFSENSVQIRDGKLRLQSTISFNCSYTFSRAFMKKSKESLRWYQLA